MQAILTKYLCPTNFRGARIKAICERGSLIIHYPDQLNGSEAHEHAARMLCEKFDAEDAVKYQTVVNHWQKPKVSGQLPNGDYAHVFVPADH